MAKRQCPKCGKFLPKGYNPGGGIYANLYKMHSCWTPRGRDGKFHRPFKANLRSYPMYMGPKAFVEFNKVLEDYLTS